MHCSKWKNYNKFIEVSEDGNVRSHGKPVKGEVCRNGYRRIHVSDSGIDYKLLVHRLVAEVFLENPMNYPVVNHKDGNKMNNSVNNLEWCSYGENLSHAFRTGLRSSDGELNPASKLTADDVVSIRNRYVRGKHGENNTYGLAKLYGVSPRTISNIIKGKTWKALFEQEEGTDGNI